MKNKLSHPLSHTHTHTLPPSYLLFVSIRDLSSPVWAQEYVTTILRLLEYLNELVRLCVCVNPEIGPLEHLESRGHHLSFVDRTLKFLLMKAMLPLITV